eukprot:TRINITY_DN6559_c0_g1_i5.p1 TRINITY_DN6559_c0_g1~~TRINITY_DN6559_c0_g1_i5.p1  ORF type:complete len:189 (+),score=-3.16 TRINITY_DN6559_c0_g1_i5:628-1194(+)
MLSWNILIIVTHQKNSKNQFNSSKKKKQSSTYNQLSLEVKSYCSRNCKNQIIFLIKFYKIIYILTIIAWGYTQNLSIFRKTIENQTETIHHQINPTPASLPAPCACACACDVTISDYFQTSLSPTPGCACVTSSTKRHTKRNTARKVRVQQLTQFMSCGKVQLDMVTSRARAHALEVALVLDRSSTIL